MGPYFYLRAAAGDREVREMIRAEQELQIVDNRAGGCLLISSTHPTWTRSMTAVERGKQGILGAEWEIDREAVALRLTPRRKPTTAQKEAVAKATVVCFGRETNAGASVASSKARPDDTDIAPTTEAGEFHALASGEREEDARAPGGSEGP